MSDGCDNCYGAADAGGLQTETGIELYQGITKRAKDGRYFYNGILKARPPGHRDWTWPLRFRGVPNPILGRGQPSIIFVCIECDLLEANRPAAVIQQVVDTMAICDHIGLFVNKNVIRYREFFAARQLSPWLWLMFSAENQTWFDRRWPYMRALAEMGWFAGVSCAPLLGPIRLPTDCLNLIRWVVVGGEEGQLRFIRDTHPDWIRSIRNQCQQHGIPLFVKRMRGEDPILFDLYIREFPTLH
jgi:protein gp37